MEKIEDILIVTHIHYRSVFPFDRLEGPYSSICQVLEKNYSSPLTLQLPLLDYKKEILIGKWKMEKKIKIFEFFGNILPLKYFIDILLITLFTIIHTTSLRRRKLIIAIDPLCCFPLAVFKKILGYKLIFYCVDFNKTRFKSKILQFFYNTALKISCFQSDQVWVVCESLNKYFKENFKINSFYIPNSSIFNKKIYINNYKKRIINRLAWSGSCLTKRQFDILFKVVKKIQIIKPDLELFFVPIHNHDEFKKNCVRYQLKKWHVLKLTSREQWQKFLATCNVGIAIYDDKFGSTKFIEPLKIWDYLLCGVPFIISKEPSVANEIKKSGCAYFLDTSNKIPKNNSIQEFLTSTSLRKLEKKCLLLAKKFAIDIKVKEALTFFSGSR